MWVKLDGKLDSIIHTFKQHNIPAVDVMTRFYAIFTLHANIKGLYWSKILHTASVLS
jgi:hypothetical protein